MRFVRAGEIGVGNLRTHRAAAIADVVVYEVRTSRCGYVAKTLGPPQPMLKFRAFEDTSPVRERCLGCLNRLVAH